ncbi:dynein regulation protein LC7 [Catellatospora methionotrophica]|uniref:Dynein regulation protein LC7 n=1 Tax=Catellatospora methionotrophica TaxID=121620 RepID=A0A8J3L5H3_9ACTN|nr:roadblock/LC7 domain-containing protein [Catellatospora methionotrophica]GIG12148.1 dynein regulation protein LC7 [Catellatospora methionotrophica]
MAISAAARDFNWLINGFAERVAGVVHTVVVSSDGLLVAASDRLPRDSADQFAAVTSSLVSVTKSAASLFDGDSVRQTVVEMGRGFLLVMPIRDGSILATLTATGADVGVAGYEMAKLCKQAGEVLTPAIRTELQLSLPQVQQVG